jgi:hypothetical protein
MAVGSFLRTEHVCFWVLLQHTRVPLYKRMACCAHACLHLLLQGTHAVPACSHFGPFPALECLQELLSERARLQSEVDALRAATAAEASSSKQELATQRAALEQQQAAVSARIEAVTEGASNILD